MAKAKFRFGDKVFWPNCAHIGTLKVHFVLHASKPDARICFGQNSESSNDRFLDPFVYVLTANKDGSIHLVSESRLVSDKWVRVEGEYRQFNGMWFKHDGT